MTAAAWRALLLSICLIAAIVQIVGVLDVTGIGGAPPLQGDFGALLGGVAPSKPFGLEITSVKPGGAAARAGLRRGDVIDIRANTLMDRLALVEAPINGRPITFSIQRGAEQKEITVVPVPVKPSWGFWLGACGSIWLLLFACLIAWRRAEVPQLRLLSLWLATFVLTGATLNDAAPSVFLYVLLDVLNIAAGPLSVGLLAAVAGCFGRPLSRPRQIVLWSCYAFLIIFAASAIDGLYGTITLRTDPHVLPQFWFGSIVGAVLTAALSATMAVLASRGVERQRAVWTIVPLAVFFAYFMVEVLANSLSPSYASAAALNLVGVLVLLVAPIALTYAAFSRRLIDIGFFLNRAAVYAIVSTIVIGAFILVEWAGSEWLAGTTHTTSAIIGMVVALALGLSLRYVHKAVERLVDRVLFRKRHEDEAALRRFAHESSYISDASILLERTVRTVKAHTDVDDASILVRDGAASWVSASNGKSEAVGENDPGIVTLRAWHKPLDLENLHDSALDGQIAFPMISRGELVGILVCGKRRDEEAYAPDELDALAALAEGVGSALRVLLSERERPPDNVASELAELRAAIERQDAVLRELRQRP